MRFYQENNSAQDNQNLTSAAQTNEDGSVSIQVYENLGDHNSTAAWYTVDRLTAARHRRLRPGGGAGRLSRSGIRSKNPLGLV